MSQFDLMLTMVYCIVSKESYNILSHTYFQIRHWKILHLFDAEYDDCVSYMILLKLSTLFVHLSTLVKHLNYVQIIKLHLTQHQYALLFKLLIIQTID